MTGPLTEADVRRIAREEATRAILDCLGGDGGSIAPSYSPPSSVYRNYHLPSGEEPATGSAESVYLGGQLLDGVGQVEDCDGEFPRCLRIVLDLRNVDQSTGRADDSGGRGVRLGNGGIGSVSHESSPYVAGTEVASSDVPAMTVAETTDTDPRGVGESAGVVVTSAPALTEDEAAA